MPNIKTDGLVSDDKTAAVVFVLGNNGELSVLCVAGPNEGKSVDLTTGKWV
jgi:hypothetical protein